MLVADGRQVDRNRAARRPLFALVAQDEAPPDIEVAVEPEPLVERAAIGRVAAPEGHRVALDRVDVTGRRLAEFSEVVADETPATGDRDRRILERREERCHDVPGRLDARVEDDDRRRRRAPDADVDRSSLPQPRRRSHDLRIERIEGRVLVGRWAVRHDDDLEPRGPVRP